MEEYAVQVTDVQTMVPPTIGVGGIIVLVLIYLFWALCLALIAKKIGRDFGTSFIMAIIPIANLILVVQMGGKPWWWFLLFFIPIVNLVISIIVWMKIAEARGKPGWWGILLVLVPIVNLIMFLILAFGKEAALPPQAPTSQPA